MQLTTSSYWKRERKVASQTSESPVKGFAKAFRSSDLQRMFAISVVLVWSKSTFDAAHHANLVADEVRKVCDADVVAEPIKGHLYLFIAHNRYGCFFVA